MDRASQTVVVAIGDVAARIILPQAVPVGDLLPILAGRLPGVTVCPCAPAGCAAPIVFAVEEWNGPSVFEAEGLLLRAKIASGCLSPRVVADVLLRLLVQTLPQYGLFVVPLAAVERNGVILLMHCKSATDADAILAASAELGFVPVMRWPGLLASQGSLPVGPPERPVPRLLFHVETQDSLVVTRRCCSREPLLFSSTVVSSPVYAWNYLPELDAFLPPMFLDIPDERITEAIFALASMDQYKVVGPPQAVAQFAMSILDV